MKTIDQLLDEHAIRLGYENYLYYCNDLSLSESEWIDIAEKFAIGVAQQALQDAAKNAIGFIKGHGVKINKESILNTKIQLP